MDLVECATVCVKSEVILEKESIPLVQPDEVLSGNDDTDDEDMFFDCDDKNEKVEPIPVWSKDPCGRLKRLGKQRLWSGSCHFDRASNDEFSVEF